MQRSSRSKSVRLLLAGVLTFAVAWPGVGAAAVSTTGVKLVAGDGIAQAYFGTAVDVFGDTLVVGAPQDDPSGVVNAGSAYVFVRAGDGWIQQAKLTASDMSASDFFGTSVAISGDTVVVGAYGDDTSAGDNAGSVHVFTRSGTAWSQQASMTAGDAAGDDYLGISVDISGDTVIAGACRDDTPAGAQVGSAYVFTRSGTAWSQQASLTAGDGAADDFFGVSVAISGDTVVAGAHSHDPAAVTDAGAAYVFTRSGTAWSVQTSLTADDAGLFDQFGGSVAVSSDTILVGSAWNDTVAGSSAGAAYVYTRSGTTWSQEASLTASDAAADDIFGSSVSLSGDTAVVGAKYRNGYAGASYVFSRSGTAWSQQSSLTATDATAGDRFGTAVAVDDDTVVVGAENDDTAAGVSAGSAWVFPPENRPPVVADDGWSTAEDTTLTVGAPGLLGNDTDPDGDAFEVVDHTAPAHGSLVMTVATGAFAYTPNANWYGTDTFTYRSTDGSLTSNWATVTINVTPVNDAPVANADPGLMQIAKSLGTSIAAGDQFGCSVAISGNTAVIGAPYDDDKGGDSGSTWVFTRVGSTWVEQAKLLASDGEVGDTFGSSVAISGDTVLVGAPTEDTAWNNTGAAYVFTRSGTTWTQRAKLIAPDRYTSDQFGISVSLSGDTAIMGATFGDGVVGNTGSAYVFTGSGADWSLQTTLTASDGAVNDKFGTSVAVDGDTVAIGAPEDDDRGSNSGSAYVFTRSGTTWTELPKYTAPGGASGAFLGASIDVSGDTVLAGASGHDDASIAGGAAFVFKRSGATLSHEATLAASDGAPNDGFGYSVAADGDTAVVAATYDDILGQDSGSVYLFSRTGSAWAERDTLTASDGAADDYFGWSVAVSGPTVLAGSKLDDDAGFASGSAYFFGGLPALVTAEDTTITVPAPGLLANDTDAEDSTLTAATQVFAEHGTSGIAVNGSFWYCPAADWNGTDHLHYRATDGTDMSTQVTVTITVTSVNDAPVAVEDTATVAEDTTLTVALPGVLANDTDADGDALTLAHYTQPLHGSVVMTASLGGFTYRPNENWYGTETFTYNATDGTAESNWTTMTITVTPTNDAPVAVDDTATVSEDTTMWVSAPGVLGNDSDAEGDALAWGPYIDPEHGTLMVYAGGGYRYDPAADFAGVDHFHYRCQDASAASAWATVTITVTSVNDAPVAVEDTATVAEDTTLTVALPGVLANDTDADGDALTLAHYTQPLHGSVVMTASLGGFTYRPNENWYGTETFTYNATDGTAESNWTTMTITVTPTNDAPTAVDDTATVAEDTTLTVVAPGLLANDSDVDGDAFYLDSWYGPLHGTVEAQTDGSWTYRARDDWFGTDTFQYVIADGNGGQATATVVVTVTNTADTTDYDSVFGADRFVTCALASQRGFTQADTVVIATGRNWPDALGGSALAGAYGAPILLVDTNDVPEAIEDEIVRLQASQAIIIGGTGAVGSAVATELAGLLTGSAEVTRVAGLTRYETGRLVAERTIERTGAGWDGTFFVATGGNYPDALGASPAAYLNAWPIVLSNPVSGLDADTLAMLDDAGASGGYILGGTGAVPAGVTTQLTSVGITDVTRFSGADRYDTAAQIASASVAAWGTYWNGLAIATGENYADALSGGPVQGQVPSVLLLTRTASLSPYTAAALTAHRDEITNLVFLGGTGAINQTVRNAVGGILW